MSWFGGGLSQFSSLTDQISTFTKDVLTETTEEVEGALPIAYLRPPDLAVFTAYIIQYHE